MQGKILIVDPIATNRIMLKVKLASAFFGVLQAGTLAEALEIAGSQAPDLIISAMDLPDGSAADLCRRLSDRPRGGPVAVLALAGENDRTTRMAALEAGVQDVLVRPFDETLLLSRVRSLIRAFNAEADLRFRDDADRALGFAEPEMPFGPKGDFVLVGQDSARLQRWSIALRPLLGGRVRLASGPDVMSERVIATAPDVFVLVIDGTVVRPEDNLRLISALRATARTRHAGILVLQTVADPALAASALDLGADDLMTDGFDAGELALRLKTLLRRKRMTENLRHTIRSGLRAASLDPLTGLYNRRYAMPHLTRVADQAQGAGRPFAVMVCDLDHFKRINDLFGHASGDAALVQVADRLRGALRPADLAARIGGEEFMIVMPGLTLPEARQAAGRLCHLIGSRPFDLPGSATPVRITISIGMAMASIPPAVAEPGHTRVSAQERGNRLMEEADRALYAAKVKGRNQVELGRPAA